KLDQTNEVINNTINEEVNNTINNEINDTMLDTFLEKISNDYQNGGPQFRATLDKFSKQYHASKALSFV
ncbi:30293_t:CDS:1, partial [Racocetra persica]